ncbi:hypothetical protein EV127DRAFT_517925 [Xylaria flabelliformis]|nr:hypothetical protein EV127DRAFT_517925 [Xylaria flabelliformis]
MSSSVPRRALYVLGKVSRNDIGRANGKEGSTWLNAIDIAEQTTMAQYPNITGVSFTGARAHQSHEVATHANVISAKFWTGDKRAISGHIMMNGYIEFGKNKQASTSHTSSRDTSSWKPDRKEVDTKKWAIYDPVGKKTRKVHADENSDWWFVEIGGVKTYF